MMLVDQKMTLDEIKHDQKRFLLEYGIETHFNESNLDYCLMHIASQSLKGVPIQEKDITRSDL